MTPGKRLGYAEWEKLISGQENKSLSVILNVVGTNRSIASFHADLEESPHPGLWAFTQWVTFEFDVCDCTLDMTNDPELPTIWIGELEHYQEGDSFK